MLPEAAVVEPAVVAAPDVGTLELEGVDVPVGATVVVAGVVGQPLAAGPCASWL